jgi:hypothetical protein
MNAEDEVVAAEGVASNGDTWAFRYRPKGDGGRRHYMAFFVNGGIREEGSGWDIPRATEIGFSGGLKPGQGHYYLYGLATSRIASVRAESGDGDQSEVSTTAFPTATGDDGSPLRTFVLIRPPVEDVTALVGLDSDGNVVQRIPLVAPPGRP